MSISYKLKGLKCKCGRMFLIGDIPPCIAQYFTSWDLCQQCGRSRFDGIEIIVEVIRDPGRTYFEPATWRLEEFVPNWKEVL